MYRIFIVIIILAAFACKKNVQPEQTTPPDLSVNFYNASELLRITSTAERKYIFVDGYDTANTNQPFFYYYSGSYLDEYPRDPGVMPVAVSAIPYTRLEAGGHRFVFTNAKKFKLADTSLTWQAGTHQQLYLANEMPTADSSANYRVVNVQEDRKRVEGKVRVRFINLSGDTDSLNVYRVDADGRRIFSGMPNDIRFATATMYAELDTAGNVNQRLTLQFFKGTDTVSALLSASVPAIPGNSYVLLIQGFRSSPPNYNSIPFKNPVGRDAAGNIIYERVQVAPNLRAVVRQSY
jgi:hypothetical protein